MIFLTNSHKKNGFAVFIYQNIGPLLLVNQFSDNYFVK